jgi:hypothetical protein
MALLSKIVLRDREMQAISTSMLMLSISQAVFPVVDYPVGYLPAPIPLLTLAILLLTLKHSELQMEQL